jgi:hypothetical protein
MNTIDSTEGTQRPSVQIFADRDGPQPRKAQRAELLPEQTFHDSCSSRGPDLNRRPELEGIVSDDDPTHLVEKHAETPPVRLSKTHVSFVERYVRYAGSRTDAPLEAHELMAVCLLSGLAGPNPRIPIATSVNGLRLALWGMYIVNTTAGRKTTVIELARDIGLTTLPGEAILARPEGAVNFTFPCIS